MKKFLIFLFSFLIGTGLFIWIINFVGWSEIRNTFLIFTGWQGLVILGLTFLMVFLGIWKWKEILKSQGHNIPLTSLAGPYISWLSMAYLFPMMFLSAEFFKVYILRKNFSVSWNQGIASVIIHRILAWTIYLIVFFIGIIFLFMEIGLPPKGIGLILFGIFLLFVIAISFFYFKGFKKESMVKFFMKYFNNKKYLNAKPLEVEKEIFKFLNFKKSFFWKALSFTFLITGIALARTWILIFFLGETIGFFPALSILGFQYAAMLIPIPANIGSHEAIQVFVFGAINLRVGAATAFTMIIRGADIIVSLIGIIALFKLGAGLLQDNLFRKIENLVKNKHVN